MKGIHAVAMLLLVSSAAPAGAQASLENVVPPGVRSRSAGAPGVDGRHQLALDIGLVAGALSYARRIETQPLSLGVSVWGAFEPPETFDRNVWEPLGVAVFARHRMRSWLHADLGVTAARYVWTDDCSECSGTFAGLRSALLLGGGVVFFGPELSLGVASDDRHGSALGILYGAQVRLLLGWGD